MDAIMEILTIGREAGIPVMIDHIHPKGPREWGMSKVTTQLIDEMWEDGHPVYLNMHSYEGYSAYVTLMPRWALIEGEVPGQSMADDFPPVTYGDIRANLRARLGNPEMREMIRRDAEYEMIRQGGAENLLITDFPDQAHIGNTLADLAAEREETPFETAIWLQMNGFDRPGGVLWMAQAVSTEDIVEWMVQDYTAVTLDRFGDRPEIRDNPAVHPGQYGTSGRLIQEHVMNPRNNHAPPRHPIHDRTGRSDPRFGRPWPPRSGDESRRRRVRPRDDPNGRDVPRPLRIPGRYDARHGERGVRR